MWNFNQASDEQLDSILFFLCSSLSSAIDDGDYLSRHSCELPDIRPGLATEEISSRLATFREQIWDVGNCEALVLTRITRAREWALALRRHEPHLRADIDAFMSATASCEPLSRRLMPDAGALFDGAAQPRRFFARRLAPATLETLALAESEPDAREDLLPHSYMLAGETNIADIIDACDRLLVRLGQHYGWDEMQPDTADDNDAVMEASEAGEVTTAAVPDSSQAQDAPLADHPAEAVDERPKREGGAAAA
jgi:hypothetical protein